MNGAPRASGDSRKLGLLFPEDLQWLLAQHTEGGRPTGCDRKDCGSQQRVAGRQPFDVKGDVQPMQ